LSVALVGCSVGGGTSQGSAKTTKAADDQITAKLEEVLAIKEKLVERGQQNAQRGIGEATQEELIEMWEARVRLAQARGDTKGVTAGLQGIIDVLRQGLDRAQAMEKIGTAGWSDVARAKCRLLEAEVRLLDQKSG
jgi:hypothetical protein